MLDAHEFVLERLRFALRLGQHLVEGLGDVDFRHINRAAHLWQPRQLPVGGQPQRADGQAELLDQRRHDAALLREKRDEQVPRLHLVV